MFKDKFRHENTTTLTYLGVQLVYRTGPTLISKCTQLTDNHALIYLECGCFDLSEAPNENVIIIGSLGHGS